MSLARDLPAALVALFGPTGAPRAEATLGVELPPGACAVGPGRIAFLPLASDPAVFDAALAFAQRLAGGAENPQAPRALVLPATVRVEGASATLAADGLLADLDERPPRLQRGSLYFTARASQGLESGHRFQAAGSFEGISGRSVPLMRWTGERADQPPWRNPELLGRRLRWIRRPTVDAALDEALAAPALAVVGPLGCGKSRAVAEATLRRGATVLWASCPPLRAGSPTLGRQLLSQALLPGANPPFSELTPDRLAALLVAAVGSARRKLTAGAVWLVCDELERAGADDWRLIDSLLGASELGRFFRLVLIARSGAAWPESGSRLSHFHLTPLEPEPYAQLAAQLFAGLSLPDEVEARLREAAAGSPWLLEEAAVQLAASRRLRRVYGSFFWSGEAEFAFAPSARLVRHVEAEVARLGESLPLALLAALEHPVPLAELKSASRLLDQPLAFDWERPYLAAGWLRFAEGPWGEGVELPAPAIAATLAATLPPPERERARRALGELIAELSQAARARWLASRLLAGTEEGARLVLAAAGASGSEVPRAALFAALGDEIAAARERGESRLEFDLLWALLPLARRLGRLHEVEPQMDRAFALAEPGSERFLAVAALRAELSQLTGSFREAESILRQALSAGRSGDERRRALLLVELGRNLLRQGRYPEARELFEKTLEALEAAGRTALAATCRFYLGNLALHQNRLVDAEELHQRALAERRKVGLEAAAAASCTALGAVLVAIGNYPQALDYYREAREALATHGREGEESFALLGMGRTLGRLGDDEVAAQPLRRALELRTGKDDRLGEAIARLAVAEHHLRLSAVDEALREARRAHFDLGLLPESEALGEAERLLGEIHLARRGLSEASAHLSEALRIARRFDKPVAAATALAALLETALAEGEPRRVARFAQDLATAVEALDEPPEAESLNLRLFRASSWLRERGAPAPEPLPFLRRAYDELLRKTGFLAPEMRHRFLFGVADHRGILEAATRAGLPSPTGSAEPGESASG